MSRFKAIGLTPTRNFKTSKDLLAYFSDKAKVSTENLDRYMKLDWCFITSYTALASWVLIIPVLSPLVPMWVKYFCIVSVVLSLSSAVLDVFENLNTIRASKGDEKSAEFVFKVRYLKETPIWIILAGLIADAYLWLKSTGRI